MSLPNYGRFWTFNVIVGVLAIFAGIVLVAWLVLHPTPHWPEFDMKDAGGQLQAPERTPDAPAWVGA